MQRARAKEWEKYEPAALQLLTIKTQRFANYVGDNKSERMLSRKVTPEPAGDMSRANLSTKRTHAFAPLECTRVDSTILMEQCSLFFPT